MTNIVDANRFRARSSARSTGGSDGGNMDDVLRRLSGVESLLTEARIDIGAIKATLPHLATKAETNEIRSDLSALETRLIRWLVGTTIATMSVGVSAAFAIAKFVH